MPCCGCRRWIGLSRGCEGRSEEGETEEREPRTGSALRRAALPPARNKAGRGDAPERPLRFSSGFVPAPPDSPSVEAGGGCPPCPRRLESRPIAREKQLGERACGGGATGTRAEVAPGALRGGWKKVRGAQSRWGSVAEGNGVRMLVPSSSFDPRCAWDLKGRTAVLVFLVPFVREGSPSPSPDSFSCPFPGKETLKAGGRLQISAPVGRLASRFNKKKCKKMILAETSLPFEGVQGGELDGSVGLWKARGRWRARRVEESPVQKTRGLDLASERFG